MAEYASKGVSGTALGLSIAGTVGLVNSLSQNGNGFLGGLFGNGNNSQMEELRSENTLLKANRYTDNQNKDLEREICQLKSESAVQAEQIAAMKREGELREQLTDCKIAKVADAAKCGIDALRCSLECLQQTVAGITRTYVPAASVTPLPAPWPYPPVPPYGPPIPFPPPFVPPAVSNGTTGGTVTQTTQQTGG